MEGGISRLDCYEDMFKEITRKLYGEDPDHRTSSVQNEFETSVSYKNDEDTGNGTDGSDDGNWTCEEEPLKGTDGSRIAAYHANKATWRCYECDNIMGGGPREVAEHFMEMHSSRILPDDSRHRHHSPRKDYLQTDFKVDDIVTYLERLRERAERAAPPTRRTQETQTLPATLLPMTPTFLLQELPSTSQSQHLHQTTPPPSTSTPATSVASKRYNCKYCPYGTDRRDLFVRHENIHREQKPFYCYECNKPFNRADHVKKHFTRMHRDSTYDVSRIRRPPEPKSMSQDPTEAPGSNNSVNGQQQQHVSYQTFTGNREYQMQPTPGTSNGAGIYQAPTMQNMTNISGISPTEASTSRRGQNSGCHSRSHTKSNSKNTGERRFSCQFCPWTGVDNWCLKRHLNTHIKPYSCSLCDYKAARSERLSTHLSRVHAKKQCTKCGFLCDTEEELHVHQLQAHRMSNTSTSASRVTPPTNRAPMQEPIHPPVGGRAPPGPPVFPPPQQPIVQPSSGSVVPSTSTLLGHEMVKSPATATTMAYPTEEEKRSYCRAGGVNGDGDVNHDDVDHADDNDGDSDNVVRSNGNREERSRDFGARHVRSFKSDRDFESCSDHINRYIKDNITDVSNRDSLMQRLFGIDVSDRTIPIHINFNMESPQEQISEQPNFHQIPDPNGIPLSTDMLHAALIRRLHGQEEASYVNDFERARRRKQLFPQRVNFHEMWEESDEDFDWLSPNQSPDQSPDQSPTQSSDQSPTQSSNQSPTQSSDQSPTQSLDRSPDQSSDQSPEQSSDQSPEQSSDQSPEQSSDQSPDQSPHQSPTANNREDATTQQLMAGRGTVDEGHRSYQTQDSLLLHVNDQTEEVPS